MQPVWKKIVLASILVIGVALSVRSLYLAQEANHSFGFPLDDSWIHLQFARNLHDYGAFSYYKNEMVTAGSTSPFYTILLAFGFFITSNEMILSYVLGIVSLAFAAFMMYKLATVLFNSNIVFALAAALLLIIEPRLQWFAISGMETTLFIALLLAAIYFFYKKRPVPLGISSGLLLWTRPEAIILFGVIVIVVLYEAYLVKNPSHKKNQGIFIKADFVWIKQSMIYGAIVILIYAIFNLYLSGSFLPNTYAAKLKYYAGSNSNFLAATFHFLTDGHFLIPAILVMLSVLRIIWYLLNRKSSLMVIPLLWSLLLFIAYQKYLPMLYQNGRYLVPILPCFLLLTLDGLGMVLNFLKRWFRPLVKFNVSITVSILIVLIFAVYFCTATIRQTATYTETCRYITDRQVQTAYWIRDYLPPDAVVATHDIGAIAFYSGRRVVDMVGLVSPEMINNVGRFDLLIKFLERNHVTHIAALRNWFEIVNTSPLFQTDLLYYEVMQVFPFNAARIRFAPQQATRLNDVGEYYLLNGDIGNALILLRRSLLLDSQSARTNYLLGKAELSAGNVNAARERFTAVLVLQPDFPGIYEQIASLKKMSPR
jgi:hypothetical protein